MLKRMLASLTPADIFKLLAAALAYGILVGQVAQIDQRLARVEAALLGATIRHYAPLVPPAQAGEPK